MNAFIDVIGGLGESKKAVLLGSPLQRFRHGCPGKRYAVVVHEEHDIGAGLLQHRIHPEAVIQFPLVLGQWELEMVEDVFLFSG